MRRFSKTVKILLYFNYIWLMFGVVVALIKPIRNHYSYELSHIVQNLLKLDPIAIFEAGMIFLVSSSIISLSILAIDLYEENLKRYSGILLVILFVLISLLLNSLL